MRVVKPLVCAPPGHQARVQPQHPTAAARKHLPAHYDIGKCLLFGRARPGIPIPRPIRGRNGGSDRRAKQQIPQVAERIDLRPIMKLLGGDRSAGVAFGRICPKTFGARWSVSPSAREAARFFASSAHARRRVSTTTSRSDCNDYRDERTSTDRIRIFRLDSTEYRRLWESSYDSQIVFRKAKRTALLTGGHSAVIRKYENYTNRLFRPISAGRLQSSRYFFQAGCCHLPGDPRFDSQLSHPSRRRFGVPVFEQPCNELFRARLCQDCNSRIWRRHVRAVGRDLLPSGSRSVSGGSGNTTRPIAKPDFCLGIIDGYSKWFSQRPYPAPHNRCKTSFLFYRSAAHASPKCDRLWR